MNHQKESHHVNNYRRYTKRLLFSIGTIILILGVFVGGIMVGDPQKVKAFFNGAPNYTISQEEINSRDLSEFWYVWKLMQEKYPFKEKEPKDGDKIYGAISGLVASYKDPYTMFFPPQQAKLFNEQVKGSFGGVGMEVGMKNGFITVIAPLKDSPADHAGVKAGDIIATVDDLKTDDLDIDTVISHIRGKVGTPVTLGLVRKGASEIIKKTITRDIISLPVLDTETQGDVFIISLYSFSENAVEKFTQALEAFNNSGKEKLIIDVRNNPGGYLEAAIDIASYFLPNGTPIVRERSGSLTPEVVHKSNGYTLLKKNPKIVVLINGGSASASEILAGALSENGVAATLGTTSFGKGSVQQVIDLDDGSALKVTVAKWYTPHGISISEKGIIPDHVVEITEDALKKTPPEDTQLLKALQLLK